MKRERISRFHVPLVTLWVTLSVAGLVLSWLNWRTLSNTVDRGVHLAAFNDRLEGVFRVLLNAETGERGFLITGKESYLTPLYEAEAIFTDEFKQLTALAASDPEMIQRVMTLRGLAESRLIQIRQSVAVRREKGYGAAAALMNTDESKMNMDQIRSLVEQMRRDRPNLLTLEGERPRALLRRANYTSLTAAMVGVGAGLFAFRLARLGMAHEKRERELAQEKVQAEESSEQKSAFLANMSHEIRTPMNSILGFSELLASEITAPRQRQYLNSLRSSALSLLQLINDVLDMSKIEAGVMQLQPEPTDPREICEFLNTVFSEQATRKGIRVVCDLGDDVPRSLLLDRTRLRQILVNLVGNAVKFTERGQVRVTLGAEIGEDETSRITLLIDVEDTGCGVPREQLNAIFEPFVQTHPRRTQETEGTGLGLSIVRRLTEMMGGSIDVASVMGQGTTFHLRFPNVGLSARIPASQQVNSDPPADFNEIRPSRLLVVDDNQTNRELIAGLFAGSHHELHFAGNGAEAVANARDLLPDLVLMDFRMPVMDGRTALDRIRTTPGLEMLPVIAVTASGSPEGQGEEAAFDGYLRKPFSRRALYDELVQFLPRMKPPREKEAGQVRAVTGTPPTVANGAASSSSSSSWTELAVSLRTIQSIEWEKTRETLSVVEVRRLAERLQGLGHEFQCSPLIHYAETVLEHCEAYAVPEMEASLDAFPSLIEEVERS